MNEMNIKELARRLVNAHGDPEKFGDAQSLVDYLERVEQAGDEIFERIPLDEQAAAHSVIQSLASLHLIVEGKIGSAIFIGTPTEDSMEIVRTLFCLAIGIAALEEWR